MVQLSLHETEPFPNWLSQSEQRDFPPRNRVPSHSSVASSFPFPQVAGLWHPDVSICWHPLVHTRVPVEPSPTRLAHVFPPKLVPSQTSPTFPLTEPFPHHDLHAEVS